MTNESTFEKSLIKESEARAIINLMMSCYKAGLKDAEEICDKYTCEDFKKEVRVEAELGRISGVAEGAPAAITRPRTVRIDAVGGGLEHLDGAAKGKFLFLLIDACTHRFVG